MDEKDLIDVAKEATKEIAKDVYQDGGKPIVKPTGELVGLVPRAVKAALFPLEKWILQKEYNIAETKKLLEEKLQNTPPESIEPPEPHIAVPAIQYISYCMDNDELRNMYANLLANSMKKVVKNGVHPGFVEIIKQLSPDEAKILQYMSFENRVPTIGLSYEFESGSESIFVNEFSNVPELTMCENQINCEKYFDNLERLGLISRSVDRWISNESVYEPLKNHNFIKNKYSIMEKTSKNMKEFKRISYKKGFCDLTSFGKAFCSICLDPINTITITL